MMTTIEWMKKPMTKDVTMTNRTLNDWKEKRNEWRFCNCEKIWSDAQSLNRNIERVMSWCQQTRSANGKDNGNTNRKSHLNKMEDTFKELHADCMGKNPIQVASTNIRMEKTSDWTIKGWMKEACAMLQWKIWKEICHERSNATMRWSMFKRMKDLNTQYNNMPEMWYYILQRHTMHNSTD